MRRLWIPVSAAAVALLLATAFGHAQPGGGQRGPGVQGGPSGQGGPGGPPPPPPLIAALDANHDGIIDAQEIDNAPAALRTLDKNKDGKLTPDEYRPRHPGGRGPQGPEGGDRPSRPGDDSRPSGGERP